MIYILNYDEIHQLNNKNLTTYLLDFVYVLQENHSENSK